jgi:heterodisulfide reductase subunit A-like polyferredoxin
LVVDPKPSAEDSQNTKMRAVSILGGLAIASAPLLASASPAKARYARVVRDASALADEYDYVIVGGGTAGLTVGDRLTEDGKTTVLVLEHGQIGR